LAQRQFRSLTQQSSALFPVSGSPAADEGPRSGETVRIGSFNLHNYGSGKAKRTHVMQLYGKILRQFDVVAVQGIRTEDSNVIAALLDRVNEAGGGYAIITSPRIGQVGTPQQYAFIYNTRRIEPLGVPYVVSDPENLLNRPPFVGWFRCRGVTPQQAFTFSLANFQIDEAFVDQESRYLVDLCQAIRQDGRQEDDVILAGTLQMGDHELTPRLAGSSYNWLIRGQATAPDGDWQVDNFVLDPRATQEFTGRSGVLDFLRQENLNIAQALEVSEHLPIWAEFFIHEGRSSGLVATGSAAVVR
jgi:hypothetical protein